MVEREERVRVGKIENDSQLHVHWSRFPYISSLLRRKLPIGLPAFLVAFCRTWSGANSTDTDVQRESTNF